VNNKYGCSVKKKEQHTIVVVDDRVGDRRSERVDLDGDGGPGSGEVGSLDPDLSGSR
jgi:hypothetical protein